MSITEDKNKEILCKLGNKYQQRVVDALGSSATFLEFKIVSERLDKNKCKFICNTHKEICYPQISNVLHRKRSGCKHCAQESRNRKSIKDEDVFLEELRESCAKHNCTFLGYVEDYKGSYHTEVKLKCNIHTEEDEFTCTGRILSRPARKTSGCPSCFNEHFLQLSIKRNQKHINVFFDTGKFHPNSTFCRDEERKTTQGVRSYWKVVCGDCGESYPSCTGTLKAGSRGCSCAKLTNNMGFYPDRVNWEDTLYLLKLVSKKDCDEKECFYKIGRSFCFDKRLSNLKAHYDIDVIATITNNHKEIFEKEKYLLKSNKPYSYSPLISFGGQGECFTKEILTHPEIISTFNLK